MTNDKLWWWTGAPPPPPLIGFCRGSAVPPIVSSGPDMLLLFRCPCCFVSITFPIIVLPVSASATLHICSHSFSWSFFPLLDRHLLPLRVPRLFASTDLSSRWWWYNPLKDKLAWGLRTSQVEIDFVDSESGRFSPRDRLSGDLDCRFTFTSVARRQVFYECDNVVLGPREPLVLPLMDPFVRPREFFPLLLLILPLPLPLHPRHPHHPRQPCHPRNPPQPRHPRHPLQPRYPCHFW